MPPVPLIAAIGLSYIYAAQTSLRVPEPPPITITPSPDRAVRKSRVQPNPLGITMSQYSFAYAGSFCGIIPTTIPPLSRAP